MSEVQRRNHQFKYPFIKYFYLTKKNLLLVAAIVWMFAGIMLGYRAIKMADQNHDQLYQILCCLSAGILFYILLFRRISQKHIHRIQSLSDQHYLFHKFFDRKSYLMMIVMISMGITLRRSSLIDPINLSYLYLTMSIPLLISSLRFLHQWTKSSVTIVN